MKAGIIILSELEGPLCERVLQIQKRFDPRLAAGVAPHVTITGSSGMGPIASSTTVEQLRDVLAPIAAETAPMTLRLGRPMQFMQSDVVVLPLDPHGPLRALHERIKQAGLLYERPRFAFTPHVTLSFFRELPPAELRDLLRVRIDGPVELTSISAWKTVGLVETQKLLELDLTGQKARTAEDAEDRKN